MEEANAMCRGTLDSYFKKMKELEGTVLSVAEKKEFIRYYDKRKEFNFDQLEEIKMDMICDEARREQKKFEASRKRESIPQEVHKLSKNV